MNEEKIDELLRLMRSVVPDTSDMSDAGKVGFVYRGVYDPEAEYEEMDVVLYGQSLWTPKMDTTGNPPPDQSQEGQEDVTENDFWILFLPGALGSDYVKKTDIAAAPTEDTTGKAGIVKPDGKTITITEDGTITGSAVRTFDTEEEFRAAYAAGEVVDGMTVNIKDYNSGIVDSALSETSKNPVQNKVITAKFAEIAESVNDTAGTVSEISSSLTGTQADIDNILDGTSQVGDSAKLDGVTKDSFMGDTNFIYKIVSNVNLNTITTEFHCYARNVTNGPSNVVTPYGWLDVSVIRLSAGGFNIRQVFTQVNNNEIFIRSFMSDTEWTDWTPLLTPDMVSNPNLLINPDFSINQRGKATYTFGATKKYTVDRWHTNLHSYATVTPNDGYITISQENSSSGTATLVQPIENAKYYAGMTLTFTAKARGTNGRIALNITDNNSYTQIYFQPTAEWKTYTVQRTLGNITSLAVGVSVEGTSENSADFAWAKLEVGNVATMYIPPNPAEELEKCRHYYKELQVRSTPFVVAQNYILFNAPTDLNMRTTPTVKFKNNNFNEVGGTCVIADWTGVLVPGFTFEVICENDNYMKDALYIRAVKENHGLSITDISYIIVGKNNPICLDAEIY